MKQIIVESSSEPLMGAFTQSLNEMGFVEELNYVSPPRIIVGWKEGVYIRARGDGSNETVGTYQLPKQWDEALEHSKQFIKKKVIYIKSNCTGPNNSTHPLYNEKYTSVQGDGKVFKVIREESISNNMYNTVYVCMGIDGQTYVLYKESVLEATEEEFENQIPITFKINNTWSFKVITQDISDYGEQKLLAVGCIGSQQLYTKQSLITIKTLAKVEDDGFITFDHPEHGDIDITPKELDFLIKMLS